MSNSLRRAAVSVAANIAEEQGRDSLGEFRQFLGNSKGSLVELETHIFCRGQSMFRSTDAYTPVHKKISGHRA